jgi:hypothetical protein
MYIFKVDEALPDAYISGRSSVMLSVLLEKEGWDEGDLS